MTLALILLSVDNVHNILYNVIGMKEIQFDKEKDEMLKKTRGVGFEEVVSIIEHDKKTEAIEHPNKKKYSTQKVFIVKIKNYFYVVPFIEEKDYLFLKTIYPSRKYTKKINNLTINI